MCIVSIPSGIVRAVTDEFRVLELHAFEQGMVRGVDSAIYMPQSFEFSVEDLIEHETTMANHAPAADPAIAL